MLRGALSAVKTRSTLEVFVASALSFRLHLPILLYTFVRRWGSLLSPPDKFINWKLIQSWISLGHTTGWAVLSHRGSWAPYSSLALGSELPGFDCQAKGGVASVVALYQPSRVAVGELTGSFLLSALTSAEFLTPGLLQHLCGFWGRSPDFSRLPMVYPQYELWEAGEHSGGGISSAPHFSLFLC